MSMSPSNGKRSRVEDTEPRPNVRSIIRAHNNSINSEKIDAAHAGRSTFELKTGLVKAERAKHDAEHLAAKLRQDLEASQLELATCKQSLAEARQEAIEAKKEALSATAEHQTAFRTVQTAHRDVEHKVGELEALLATRDSELELARRETKNHREAHDAQTLLFNQEIERLRAHSASGRVDNAQVQRLELEVSRLSSELNMQRADVERSKESVLMQQQQQEELQQLRTESALAKAQLAKIGNVEMLHEELLDLRTRVGRAAEQAAQVALLEAKCAQLSAWERCASSLPGCADAEEMLALIQRAQIQDSEFSQKQQQNLQLIEKKGDLEAKLEVAEDTEDYYKCKLTETEEQLAAITNQLHDVRVHVSNCERKERLATKERDVYRGLLDSYKAEELCAPANGNGVPTASSRASERTSQLEQAYNELSEQIKSMQHDVTSFTSTISKQQARIAELELKNTKLSDAALCAVDDETQRRLELVEAENAVLGKEVESKNKELDKLSHVVAVLESKVGRGDFDARTTKVLHLGLNPEKQKLDEREALRLEEASKKTDSWEQLAERRAQEHAIMKDKCQKLEMRIDRLSKTFMDKTKKYQSAVKSIVGYEIQTLDPEFSRFKLVSVYGDKATQHLEFQVGSQDRKTDLLDTAFANTLHAEIEEYLVQGESFAAFNAAVSLKLFNEARNTNAGVE